MIKSFFYLFFSFSGIALTWENIVCDIVQSKKHNCTFDTIDANTDRLKRKMNRKPPTAIIDSKGCTNSKINQLCRLSLKETLLNQKYPWMQAMCFQNQWIL